MRFVFLCGGSGKRFEDHTPVRKPSMLILGRPMYVWTLETLARAVSEAGIEAALTVVTSADARSRDVHRDIRRRFASAFSGGGGDVKRCELPFATVTPVDTVALTLAADSGVQDEPFWVIDNDVMHDARTRFAFEAEEAERCVRVAVVDLTDSTAPAHLVDEEGGAAHEPYCYAEVRPDGRVVRVSEKRRLPGMDHAVMGAYGFSSRALFEQLRARAEATASVLSRSSLEAKGQELGLSDIVRAALASGTVHVRAEAANAAFTIGTPSQLSAALSKGLLTLDVQTSEPDHHHHARSAPMTWVFDLDETLVSLPEMPRDYATCEPLSDTIALVRRVHRAGHRVVIHTARGMVTHDGDARAAEAALRGPTEASLRALDVPYDALIFGKPYADVYVDDKAMNPRVWGPGGRDLSANAGFGLEETARPTWRPVCRNVLRRSDGTRCVKLAEHRTHLLAYARYLREAPPGLRASLMPALLDVRPNGDLELEWLPGIMASKANAWGLLTPRLFAAALSAIAEFHATRYGDAEEARAAMDASAIASAAMRNYMPKLEERLATAEGSRLARDVLGLPVEEMVGGLAAFFAEYEPAMRSCIHGDMWLGNVIWDGARARVIDMRGALGDVVTTRGDAMYDYAKLYQSLVGFDLLIHRPSACESSGEPPREALEKRAAANAPHILELWRHAAAGTGRTIARIQREVRHITLALVLGCLRFHAESVEATPQAWRAFLTSLRDSAFDGA